MHYLPDTNRRGTCRKTRFTQKKLFDAIQERSCYEGVKFAEVLSFLKGFPFEELVERVPWHRTCYQEATHSGMIERAKERYER